MRPTASPCPPARVRLRARRFMSAVLCLGAYGGLYGASEVDFNRDIRPILAENCFACHGPDEKGRKARLRLDDAASAYAERNGLTPIKPGDPAASEVWARLISVHEDEVMPPPEAHPRPTEEQKRKIKAWIEQGARYAEHWSFVPPRKAVVPAHPDAAGATARPTGASASSVHAGANAIDAFVRFRLAQEKLAPAPLADRAMLIRRVTLDLTGLPPRAEEGAGFVADADPAAYENRVERLLASLHFGERMALEWLDAARYADTNGYSIDGGRHLWLWRDWVIQAFNDNVPYDRFLLEQIAGDLLPNRTEAQLIATGFQRNNMVTHEGGTIPEENLVNYNADRVKTLGEAVLGLTLACAQCHDHKYDPLTQREYYQLFAFFNTLSDRGNDGNAGINPLPSIRARTVLRTDEAPELRRQIEALRATLAQPDQQVLAGWEQRERARLAARGKQLQLHPVKVLNVATPNRGAGFDPEGENRVRLRDTGALAAYDILTELPRLGKPVTGLRVIMHPLDDYGGGWGAGPSMPRRPRAAARAADADGPAEEDKPAKGSFMLTAIAVTADAVPGDQINLHKLQAIARVTASSWDRAHPPAGCLDPRNESGWSPDLAHTGPVHLTATFAEPIRADTTPYLTVQLNFGNGRNLVAGLIEVLVMTGTDDGTELPAEVVAALEMPPEKRSAAANAMLWEYAAQHAAELEPRRIARANLEERLAVLTEPFTTMVMDVAAKPRETFILHRGDYAQPTEKVGPGTPAALPPMPDGAPPDRLGLARWIVMREHPLTARVAVNRIWKMLLGAGLVATAADFGAQGDWPSHPELLDWLAVDFVENGWDVKRLIRQIVLSRTYQQSSASTPAMLERDPENRLLARGPRFRLPAEFVRDAALSISGLLVPRIGGPGVNPYLPADLWREVSHYGSTPATAQAFVQDRGEKLYRRSLYTYWKRTAPPPNLTAFDAPNREVCVVERPGTITPLQALVLLNDVQFVEASRAFAERILARPGDDAAKLRWAFVEATAREPKAAETAVLRNALQRERRHYAANYTAADASLRAGESPRNVTYPVVEHAAWAQVAAMLLNLSETITRN
jgi:hypothetical protein